MQEIFTRNYKNLVIFLDLGFNSPNIDGGNGVDYIEGNAGNNEIFGNSGVDIIYGDAGNDLINSGLELDQKIIANDNFLTEQKIQKTKKIKI